MRVPRDVERQVKEGAVLSEDDAAALERLLAKKPDDLDARARLLGYHQARTRAKYDAATLVERLADTRSVLMGGRGTAQDARARHALWLAANAPCAPLAAHPLCHFRTLDSEYAELSAIWRRHAASDPPNATLLAHAIAFFRGANEIFADELLARAEQLFPNERRWLRFRQERWAQELCERKHAEALRTLQKRGDDDAADRKTRREQYLTDIERLLRECDDPDFEWAPWLHEIAGKLALALDRIDRARAHAEQLIGGAAREAHTDRSDSVHNGHLLLGRVALRENDVERAKAHLMLAGRAGATGLVPIFGADLRLARELLVRDERDAVIRYLTLARAFWTRRSVDEWIATIRDGGFPDFGRDVDD